ncbi:MAG: hypothetical protein OHK0053_32890 [Microscillaceae bacterium]
MKHKFKPYQIDVNSDWVIFINGFRANNLLGFVWLWLSLYSVIRTTKKASGCGSALPAIVSPIEVVMISYWYDNESLREFVVSKHHKRYMRFVYQNPKSLSLFNEMFVPRKSGLYFNKPMGMSKLTKNQNHEQRIVIKETDPKAYKAMAELEKYMAGSQLSYAYKELIKIRASQINGCAYCIQIHTQDARKAEESEQRIYALPAWRESPLFSEEEKALLAVTDEVTRIADKGLTDKTYAMASEYFSESEVAEIIMQVVIINAWNRIAVSTHLQYPIK